MSSRRPQPIPGQFKPLGKEPVSTNQIQTIIHVTHIHNAVEMIKMCGGWNGESVECKVEMIPDREGRIFFNAPLGEGWPKNSSRYGNVVFEFDFQRALHEYESLAGGPCRFIVQGTIPYKKTSSHIVLVCPPAENQNAEFYGQRVDSQGITYLRQDQGIWYLTVPVRKRGATIYEENILPELPVNQGNLLYYDSDGKWWQTDYGKQDSNEFAFMVGHGRRLMLSGRMKFCSHRTLCVSLSRERAMGESSVDIYKRMCMVDNYGQFWKNTQRANKEEAYLEFTAAVLHFQKYNLYHAVVLFVPRMVESLRVFFPEPNKYSRYLTRTRNFRYWPKHHYKFKIHKFCSRYLSYLFWNEALTRVCNREFINILDAAVELSAMFIVEPNYKFTYQLILNSGILNLMVFRMQQYLHGWADYSHMYKCFRVVLCDANTGRPFPPQTWLVRLATRINYLLQYQPFTSVISLMQVNFSKMGIS